MYIGEFDFSYLFHAILRYFQEHDLFNLDGSIKPTLIFAIQYF